jgi:hypothetical protein
MEKQVRKTHATFQHQVFFYITDLIERKEVQIKYYTMDAMLADYMTKPLVGTKFIHFRQQIMNSK